MILAELISLPIIGLNYKFLVGLFIGALISIVAVLALSISANAAVSRGKIALVTFGLICRMILYTVGLSFSFIVLGTAAGFATSIGLLTMILGVIIINGADKTNSMEGCVFQDEFYTDEGVRKYLLIKKFSMEKSYSGRKYVTHKKFKKLVRMENK
jgi:hypothetical protein